MYGDMTRNVEPELWAYLEREIEAAELLEPEDGTPPISLPAPGQ